MRLNRWWVEAPGEIYWFEITDRADLGYDLNALNGGTTVESSGVTR